MFLDKDFEPTAPTGFDPCADCDMSCFRACPQDAFRSGSYERDYCEIQMLENESDEKPHLDNPKIGVVRYCRACEFSCPVGNTL
jgi:epoxyqueuosine reductase QueG